MRSNQTHRRRSRGGDGGVVEVVRIMRNLPQVTLAAVKGWCLGGGLAMINGHDLVISADTASSACRNHSWQLRRHGNAIAVSRRNSIKHFTSRSREELTGAEAERVGLVSQVVPENELDSYVETLAKELASRNGATLESAKIAAYMQKDLPFHMALQADDLVHHRMRYYTNPLSDVEGYLHSQKGGGTVKYVKPEERK
jgi:enoyl-CoA hydratase/carnithine racemase